MSHSRNQKETHIKKLKTALYIVPKTYINITASTERKKPPTISNVYPKDITSRIC
jgi:hypothetical protein